MTEHSEMNLIKYLTKNFYTKSELLLVTGVTEVEFVELQNKAMMPMSSYRLQMNLKCTSFFGEHSDSEQLDYYSKGYASWIEMLQSITTARNAFQIFSERYKKTVIQLSEDGFVADDSRLKEEINRHIKNEWKYFLDGTYGLCTKSGLPEDIASKEVAISLINEYLARKSVSEDEIIGLSRAVNLLDQSSSDFAPHERKRSSRFRLVDEVRRKYSLKSSKFE